MKTGKIYIKQANAEYEVPVNLAEAFQAANLTNEQMHQLFDVLENVTSETEWGKISLLIQEFGGLNPRSLDAMTRSIVA